MKLLSKKHNDVEKDRRSLKALLYPFLFYIKFFLMYPLEQSVCVFWVSQLDSIGVTLPISFAEVTELAFVLRKCELLLRMRNQIRKFAL